MSKAEIKQMIQDRREELEAIQAEPACEYFPQWEKDKEIERLAAEIMKLVAEL